MNAEEQSYDLQRLVRWQDSGATWRVLSDRKGTVSIALCRCDDESEEVDRLISDAPDLLDFVRTRQTGDLDQSE
ncbi:hypothetical protein GJV80_07440 [Microlunatus sp. Gsoil 973]|nr:hypothetical protein GJV80_07440 [Microlunatus sp. Gsoil 973]